MTYGRRVIALKKRELTPIGVVIRKRLIDEGMSQVELAEQIGTSKVYLNLILHGDRSGKKYLPKIFATLGIDPESIKRTA
jgi:transcriptional regulator with XRE-family HTH domain